jgi:hypothetical protein
VRLTVATQIRIIATPPGEAPEDVRRAWVGLLLPLADGESAPREFYRSGVLTAPRTLIGRWVRYFSGRLGRDTGYAVDADTAIAILDERAPQAATWWRENALHLLDRGRRFLFHAEVCQEEDG